MRPFWKEAVLRLLPLPVMGVTYRLILIPFLLPCTTAKAGLSMPVTALF
jgi:hypothetical protein